ncbi:MAG: ATP synthase subunit I [Pseudomonadota bacterium]
MRLSSVPTRVVVWQVVIGCFGALIWLLVSLPAAAAALAGGLGSALLSFHFAARVFSRTELAPPQTIVAAFYRAEAFKLITAAMMFGLMAKYFREGFIPFLSTFAATLLVYFAALVWTASDEKGPTG